MRTYETCFFFNIDKNRTSERVMSIMNKLDKDHSGSLSEEEFVEGCLGDHHLRFLLAPNSNIR